MGHGRETCRIVDVEHDMDGRRNLTNSQSSQSDEGRVVNDSITSPKQHCKPALLTKARVCVVWGILQRWQDGEQVRQRVAQVNLQLRRIMWQ